MKRLILLFGLLVLLGNLLPMSVMADDPADGERVLTPNEERHIRQANEDLPKDLLAGPRDSKAVADLRSELRKALFTYQKTVHQFGNGTPQSRQACHRVVDAQTALHKQFVKEEAIPALSQLPN